jgi:hypothetical protein
MGWSKPDLSAPHAEHWVAQVSRLRPGFFPATKPKSQFLTMDVRLSRKTGRFAKLYFQFFFFDHPDL